MPIKATVFSDSHGYLPVLIEPFDVLFICGDITPAYHYYSRNVEAQKEWLLNDFKFWLERLPYRDENSRVYIVPGNHDHVFERMSPEFRSEIEDGLGERVKLLIHEESEFIFNDEISGEKKIRIFGTPYCKIFYNWAFMLPDTDLQRLYQDIPEGIDVLITHDPPALNGLGTITQGYQDGKEAGNEILAKRILEVKPKFCFSGHIHSGNHCYEEYENIMMANVSVMDEQYNPVNEPLNFIIP